jgi:hypothetical protein
MAILRAGTLPRCGPAAARSNRWRGLAFGIRSRLSQARPDPGLAGGTMTSKRFAMGLAAVLLLSVSAAQAQGQMDKLKDTTPEERATLQTMMMKEKLALTPQQLPAVKQINLETATAMQPVITGSEGPLIKMRKAKGIEEQRDASLQKVLTPPQFQQWLAEKEAMRQKIEEKLMEKRQGGGN